MLLVTLATGRLVIGTVLRFVPWAEAVFADFQLTNAAQLEVGRQRTVEERVFAGVADEASDGHGLEELLRWLDNRQRVVILG